MSDPRDEFISCVVKGRSFAEVGGLWGTVNEKVSVARDRGAKSLTMIDVTPRENDLWEKFLTRMTELDIPNVDCISADIIEKATARDHPAFDVVHCSGILYHAP